MANDLTQTDPTDDISSAFEALRGEVSLTRLAVEGLTAARERIPDYSVTLGQMAQALKAATNGIERIERSPAVSLSPTAMTAELVKASVEARAEDRTLLTHTRDALARSIGRVDGIVERGQSADRQWERVLWAAGGGAFAGILLMSILPGAVARSLPASWHVPEWMAARTMGMDQREAGARLLNNAPKPGSQ
uniref:DUF6118 family protein n=1 Tax=uncultured Sphingomonas sp. TaxID=158754 RepID=UPI0035CC4F79